MSARHRLLMVRIVSEYSKDAEFEKQLERLQGCMKQAEQWSSCADED